MQTYWFFALIASICFEGLGRKFLPAIPSIVFYFLKDVVLVGGYVMLRPQPQYIRIGLGLYRGFTAFWLGAVLWTLIEVANPQHQSILLAVVGLRAYWLWWIAPFIIASALRDARTRRRAIYILSFVTIVISVMGALQFVSPPDSPINVYSVVDGEAVRASDVGIVSTTGRARVSGTFSFITGFSDFTILIPTLLLSLGIETSDVRLRRVTFVATGCAAAVLPMSGARTAVILGLGVLALTCWAAGLFFTRIGRRVVIGGVVGILAATFAFPDAIFGVESRFQDTEETQSRIVNAATIIPPVAIAVLDYPVGGIGTGMMQNAAVALHVNVEYPAEMELHKYLVELGVVGFALIWTVKLGIMVGLLRAYRILRRAGRRGAAGAALSYAAVTFFGNITFDHIWQALFFVGCGFILAETKAALDTLRANGQPRAAAPAAKLPVGPLALRS